ncbi:MAG TPA: hypothetical protein VK616_01405 [Flavitalea sp.]|nr:hypothetical protein [Flavitalea sp.]
MRFVKFVTYLFYRYYSKGSTKDVAYIKTVCSAVLLILINLWIVLILLNQTDIVPATTNGAKGMKYLKIALYTSPIFLFFFFFVREKDLKLMVFEEKKLIVASRILWIYIVLSFVLMIALMFVFAPGSNDIH